MNWLYRLLFGPRRVRATDYGYRLDVEMAKSTWQRLHDVQALDESPDVGVTIDRALAVYKRLLDVEVLGGVTLVRWPGGDTARFVLQPP